jgi:type IV secretion system protein VirB1
MLVAYALATLFARCAPAVGHVTMSALVAYESGTNAYAIGDNTARRSYFPARRADALRLATELVDAGHDIDVGFAQINIANVRAAGLALDEAFEPCTNVWLGARILEADYARATRRYGPGQVALGHALSAYNSGGFFAGLAYARGVYATAARLQAGHTP